MNCFITNLSIFQSIVLPTDPQCQHCTIIIKIIVWYLRLWNSSSQLLSDQHESRITARGSLSGLSERGPGAAVAAVDRFMIPPQHHNDDDDDSSWEHQLTLIFLMKSINHEFSRLLIGGRDDKPTSQRVVACVVADKWQKWNEGRTHSSTPRIYKSESPLITDRSCLIS